MENRNFQGRKFIFNFRKVNPTFIKILWKIRKTLLFLYSCRHVKILYITCELLTEHPPPPSTAFCSLSCRRSSCPPPQWRSCPHLWPLHNIVISLHTLQCWHDGVVNPTHSFPSIFYFSYLNFNVTTVKTSDHVMVLCTRSNVTMNLPVYVMLVMMAHSITIWVGMV